MEHVPTEAGFRDCWIRWLGSDRWLGSGGGFPRGWIPSMDFEKVGFREELFLKLDVGVSGGVNWC
eukprot:1374407-Amorphochlora_amoeboformis.AAC.1